MSLSTHMTWVAAPTTSVSAAASPLCATPAVTRARFATPKSCHGVFSRCYEVLPEGGVLMNGDFIEPDGDVLHRRVRSIRSWPASRTPSAGRLQGTGFSCAVGAQS